MKKYGFKFWRLDQPQPSQVTIDISTVDLPCVLMTPVQVTEMMLSCRKACEKLYRDTEFSQLPELVRAMGGYGDVVTDQVGHYCITHHCCGYNIQYFFFTFSYLLK